MKPIDQLRPKMVPASRGCPLLQHHGNVGTQVDALVVLGLGNHTLALIRFTLCSHRYECGDRYVGEKAVDKKISLVEFHRDFKA